MIRICTNFVCAAAVLIAMLLTNSASPAQQPTSQPIDLVVIYTRAADAIVVDSPASTSFDFPSCPPYGEQWEKIAADSWAKDGETRKLMREARQSAATTGVWPKEKEANRVLNGVRYLANTLGDDALYQHLKGDDAGAIETLRDIRFMADFVRRDPIANDIVRPLVAAGVDALTMSRLLTIAPTLKLSADAQSKDALQISEARMLIDQLLVQSSADEILKQVFSDRMGEFERKPEERVDRSRETFNRVNAENTFAAMSLACQIFRHDKNRWPKNLDELVPAYISRVPIDPWGNGKELFGYALINGVLPDGSDRPLLYSRCESRDGLMYRTDTPQYSFYANDGSTRPHAQQLHGGQFRDVAYWVPSAPRADLSQPVLKALP